LLLARLLAQPANLLVLDEPTNDLDIETLELLENMLLEYSGTLLLVSHDRAFLNNLVTSTLVMEGGGQVREYVGGYDDWQRQRQAELEESETRTQRKPLLPADAAVEATGWNQEAELQGTARPRSRTARISRTAGADRSA
jgi:ABC transport system ATP-binding/permease protein